LLQRLVDLAAADDEEREAHTVFADGLTIVAVVKDGRVVSFDHGTDGGQGGKTGEATTPTTRWHGPQRVVPFPGSARPFWRGPVCYFFSGVFD
jgi:hypothetical protein